MVVVQLLYESIAIIEGILGHFVQGTVGTASLSTDYEWYFDGFETYSLQPKGEFLAGAVADIVTYGAILADWIVQSLLNFDISLNSPA